MRIIHFIFLVVSLAVNILLIAPRGVHAASYYTIQGTVRIGSDTGAALSGVSIAITAASTPAGSGSCVDSPTDINGRYACTFDKSKSYTLTPSKTGYTFSPTSITNANSASVTGQDFVATATATTTTTTTTTTASATTTTSTASTSSTTATTTTAATTTTTVYGGTGDTDIYIDNGSLGGSSMPLVMFSLDYRASLGNVVCNNSGDDWGNCQSLVSLGYLTSTDMADDKISMFEMMRAVLSKVIEPLSGIRVGLMINHQANNSCVGYSQSGCSNGGYIRLGFEEFQANDANGAKAALIQAMADLGEPSGNDAHAYQGAELFFEFFRYLTGQGIYNGHNGYKDFGDNTAGTNLNVDFPLRSWDTTVESGSNYISPLSSTFNCAKIFTVNLMFQVSQQENDSETATAAAKASGGMGLTLSQSDAFVDVIGWLYGNDLGDGTYGTVTDLLGSQNVTSFFLVPSTKINVTTTDYASSGGTTTPYELSEDPTMLYNNLISIFNQIISVSTTFVSASVPVNVFNRTQIMDSVYIAIFQADPDGKPLWTGNIKKLKISTAANGVSFLADANNAAAVATDGRIKNDALTFWTDPTGWDVINADVSAGELSGTDGRNVVRGGAGQQIPGFLTSTVYTSNAMAGRILYTEPATDESGSYTSSTLRAWDATTLAASADVQTALGVSSSTDAETLINFSRGMDVSDFDGDSSTTDLRSWLLGDSLHSQVMPVNYGAMGVFSSTNPDMRLLMGSNDGYMHMFQDTNSAGDQVGVENWGFIPLEVAGQLSRLKSNTPGTPKHPHMVDGAAATYIKDVNSDGTVQSASGDLVYAYFGLRRGGESYYALDITDPDAPAMLWSAKQSVGSSFSEMGLTFSNPRVKTISYAVGDTTYSNQPVLIFGGGYDVNKDTNVLPGTDDTTGNAIYIVNATSGALIWKVTYGATTEPAAGNPALFYHADMRNSIPSEVATLDSNLDGLVDRIYVGDTGGDVWRVDMSGTDRSKWVANKILSLGRSYSNTATEDRRFFHRPDVVRYKDSIGYYDAVILGSGDREDPLDKNDSSTKVVNWIYMFKDRTTSSVTSDSAAMTARTHAELADLTSDCLQDASCDAPAALDVGWRIQLESSGEKVLSSPLTIAGVIYVTSYIPPSTVEATTCGPSEGSGVLYTVSLANATAPPRVDQITGEEIAETADDPLTKADRKTTLASGGIPSDVVILPPKQILRPDLTVQKISQKSFWKTYWYHTTE
ncbi:MAG: hypothetical protein HQL75_12160 [Magnetococcales bacterium]|nr:hypothetical protein [Magnetococcales bacterium]